MYGAGDIRIERVPDPSILEPTDAILRVVRACICGSDLWPYNDMPRSDTGQSMGHEAIGVVEAVGRDVRTVKRGQVVVMLAPSAFVRSLAASRWRPTFLTRSLRSQTPPRK
jgi:threonine dehydrogenase-like Zn-dependent dehydrogenase